MAVMKQNVETCRSEFMSTTGLLCHPERPDGESVQSAASGGRLSAAARPLPGPRTAWNCSVHERKPFCYFARFQRLWEVSLS
jgi:hypothetical protein